LNPLAGNTGYFKKHSEHFIKSIQEINLQNGDYLVSFDVVSLFTNVPMEEILQVIRNRLSMDHSFPERSSLQVEDVMELLDICLTTTYFQFEDKFYQKKESMAVGNSLSPVIFMEHSEEIALDTADYKPSKWLRYVDDTFVVWPHGPAKLQEFLHHLNSVRATIKFTMEVEANNTLQFLDDLVMKRGPELTTKVHRKPTHTGRYLHFKCNHPHHVKRKVFHSLVNRTKLICQYQIFTTKLKT
jgi:hypothetical protein